MEDVTFFEMKLPDDCLIKFEENMNFIEFICQFQAFFPKILCIIDKQKIKFYDKDGEFPNHLKLISKDIYNSTLIYTFQDNTKIYTIFGYENAKIFQKNFIDNDIKEKKISVDFFKAQKKYDIVLPSITNIIINKDKDFQIIDNGQTFNFPNIITQPIIKDVTIKL
jgi:hypothetical protein